MASCIDFELAMSVEHMKNDHHSIRLMKMKWARELHMIFIEEPGCSARSDEQSNSGSMSVNFCSGFD